MQQGVFVQPCVLVQQVLPMHVPVPAAAPKVQRQAKRRAVEDGTRTSIMLRNILNNLKRDALLTLFDTLGFQGLYNFLYLPIDFVRKANIGYAFVNLVDAAAALRF